MTKPSFLRFRGLPLLLSAFCIGTSFITTSSPAAEASALEKQVVEEFLSGHANFLSQVDYSQNPVQHDAISYFWARKNIRLAKEYMERLESLIVKASGGRYDYKKFCGEFARFLADTKHDYGFNVCYRPDWKTSTKDLLQQMNFDNTVPSKQMKELERATIVALRWLARNDGSPIPFVDHLNCEQAERRQDDGLNFTEKTAIEKLQREGNDISRLLRPPTGFYPPRPGELPCEAGGYQLKPRFAFDINGEIWLMQAAYGAVPAIGLPAQMEGLPTNEVVRFLVETTGGESSPLVYTNRGRTYYALPALILLAQQEKDLLVKALSLRWSAVPLETASLWALQELSITKNQPVSDFAILVGADLYISPEIYAKFMKLYRANKKALASDAIVEAIQQLRTELKGEIAELKAAIESNGAITREGFENLSQQMGRNSRSIRRAIWLTSTVRNLRR